MDLLERLVLAVIRGDVDEFAHRIREDPTLGILDEHVHPVHLTNLGELVVGHRSVGAPEDLVGNSPLGQGGRHHLVGRHVGILDVLRTVLGGLIDRLHRHGAVTCPDSVGGTIAAAGEGQRGNGNTGDGSQRDGTRRDHWLSPEWTPQQRHYVRSPSILRPLVALRPTLVNLAGTITETAWLRALRDDWQAAVQSAPCAMITAPGSVWQRPSHDKLCRIAQQRGRQGEEPGRVGVSLAVER